MLRNLLDSKLSTNFIIIADTEDLSGQDLFITALRNHIVDDSTTRVNLICYENPPGSYLQTSTHQKVVTFNYFTDPCGWSDSAAPKSDLTSFTSNPVNLSETAFFIDSLTHCVNYHGYCTTYRTLSALKQLAHKIVCLAHFDLFSAYQVEELHFLATVFITLKEDLGKKPLKERIAQVVHKKSGGKVIKQAEAYIVNDDLKIVSRVSGTKAHKSTSSSGKEDIQQLMTFKLGLQMSENERKAKEELVLPYVKTKMGEIIYQLEDDEFEEDPDDDLDI